MGRSAYQVGPGLRQWRAPAGRRRPVVEFAGSRRRSRSWIGAPAARSRCPARRRTAAGAVRVDAARCRVSEEDRRSALPARSPLRQPAVRAPWGAAPRRARNGHRGSPAVATASSRAGIAGAATWITFADDAASPVGPGSIVRVSPGPRRSAGLYQACYDADRTCAGRVAGRRSRRLTPAGSAEPGGRWARRELQKVVGRIAARGPGGLYARLFGSRLTNSAGRDAEVRVRSARP